MELTTPEEFEERAVIDIEIAYPPSGTMGWTINDNAAANFSISDTTIRFTIAETGEDIRIERQNCVWTGVRRLIRKYPKRKTVSPPPAE